MALVLAITAWMYFPGLQGPFVFDDYANLPALGAQGPIDDGPALLRYLTSGHADPTGRPLATASFLIEARDWPADPRPFKRDNLILHLLNGALLFTVLLRLGRVLHYDEPRARFAALVGASAWVLHPLFVSTVLYVVQREAMLPATFTLAALLTWLQGRDAIIQRNATPWLTTALIYVLTLLATLCKANGLLIPLLLCAVQLTLRSDAPLERRARHWTLMTLGPVAVITLCVPLWVAISSIGSEPIAIRGWTVGQRLLTEPAILLDYLGRLTLILPPDSTLFHDQYRAASGALAPWYTLPTIGACAGLLVAAWRLRQQLPALSMAILFFFGGHLMESSSLALELYFEHRNYLPSMLLFWPLGFALARIPTLAIRYVLAIACLAAAALLTYTNANLWADPLRQARAWASLQPDSPRAQVYVAQLEADAGETKRAISHIDDAALHFPDEPQVALTRIDLHCMRGTVSPLVIHAAASSAHGTSRDPGVLLTRWYENALAIAAKRTCSGLDRGALTSILDAAASNPAVAALPGRRQDIAHLRGMTALDQGDASEALTQFNAALAEEPSPAFALNQAAALGTAGYPSLGIQHLAYFEAIPSRSRLGPRDGMPWVHELVLRRQGYWTTELANLRDALQRHTSTSTQ